MKLILDTNCYLSYLNRRHEDQHQQISNLIDAVSRAEHDVVFTGHNMTEIVFVLQSVYKIEPRRIRTMLADLLANPGFHFAAAHYPNEILGLWPNQVKDYGDAVLAGAALALHTKVATFDQTFSQALKKLDLLAALW